MLQRVTACCSVLQHTATYCNTHTQPHTATHCKTLQHTATHGHKLSLSAQHDQFARAAHLACSSLKQSHCHKLQHIATHCNTFFDGYCSTVQGLLDWFEVDLGFTELHFFKLICVFCVFLFSTPAFHSPLVLFGHSALPPPRGGSASRVSPQSCQSHESLWGS